MSELAPTLELLTASELAQFLKVTTAAIRKWSTDGCPRVPLGTRLVRFRLNDVLNWLEARSQRAKEGSV